MAPIRRALVAALLVGGSGAAGWFASTRAARAGASPSAAPRPDPAPDGPAREVADLRRQVQELQQERDQARAAAGRRELPHAADDVRPARAPDGPGERPSREERSARRLENLEAYFAGLERQPGDDTRVRELEGTLAGEAFEGSHVVRAECRSGTCRAEVEHATENAWSIYRDNLPRVLGDGSSYVRLLGSEPNRSLLMYFPRKE